MKEIPLRRPPDNDARFFLGDTTEDGTGRQVQLKLPDFATRLDISRFYLKHAVTDGQEEFSGDIFRAMAAIVGCCWWAADREIEADIWDHRHDLLKFGHLVMLELDDEGFTHDQIARLSVSCFEKIADSHIAEQEVQDQQDFSPAQVVTI